MKIKLNESCRKALDISIVGCGDEKRILSPDPANEPYWHHLARVYHYLCEMGEQDESVLHASLLHDAVEDGHTTLAEVKELFGERTSQIVDLLTELVYSDHTSGDKRYDYFERIKNHPDVSIKRAAIKVKCADRYDNLIGLSFTSLDKKKMQYRDEIKVYIMALAKEVGMDHLIRKGLAILDGNGEVIDLTVELV